MAITNTKSVFGASNVQPLPQRTTRQQEEFVPSEYWINFGNEVDLEDEEGKVDTDFIGLPKGLPLDTMKEIITNTSNDRAFYKAQAQNQLLADIREASKSLAPGESMTFTITAQILRVKPKREMPTPDENPFVRKLSFKTV